MKINFRICPLGVKMNLFIYLWTVIQPIFFLFEPVSSQLVVNVKNKGGDILQETIEANVTQDTVLLQLRNFDGTIVSQFIDFRNEVQIFKTIILGEVERGQHGFQVMCFVVRFVRNEFVSSDAMSKLRQKNPGAIRHPEEEKAEETIQMDALLDLEQTRSISPYIAEVCKDARDLTYVRENDLNVLSKALNKDNALLLGAAKHTPLYKYPMCHDQKDITRPCVCSYQLCVGWYPCGLKYCKGKDSTGKVVSYRCGIKTCSKCRLFEYYSRQKAQCLWDWETSALTGNHTKTSQEVRSAKPQGASLMENKL